MFTWLPLIGPFIQGAVNMFNHWQDTKVQLSKINADKEVSEDSNSAVIIAARAKYAPNDIGFIFARDVIVNWYAVYVSLIFYDSCFRNLLPAWMTWRVLAIPGELHYLVMCIIGCMFYTGWRGDGK